VTDCGCGQLVVASGKGVQPKRHSLCRLPLRHGVSFVLARPPMPPMSQQRRLEDRIRELCAKAVATPESRELTEVAQQLKSALHEHAQRARKRLFTRNE
jgi:hypothetical protein